MLEQAKNTCEQVFGKRLRELRKENGYTIEQFADMVGISKSTLGYYENDKRMPDIEILARIANVLNVNADYLIGRTNTTAQKGKMKTVCEFTGVSNQAAEYLSKLVDNKRYEELTIINHLFAELGEDSVFENYLHHGINETASSVLGTLIIYFEKRACWEIDWDKGERVQQMKENSVMKNAYVHYPFEQVTTAIKNSSEVYSEENAPWK